MIGWILLTAIAVAAVPVASARAQCPPGAPVASTDPAPAYSIEARARNGNTGFEAIVFTPGNPSPLGVQLNPAGAPAWSYGDAHNFELTYSSATGTAVWRIDFNRDGDYLDSQESATSVSPTLVGQGFEYLNLFVQAGGSGTVTASVAGFTVNGTPLGAFSSSSETATSQLYEADTGVFADITASGSLSFSAGVSQERPRVWVLLGAPKALSTDTDGDGTPDCIDGCPTDPGKIAPGACGCGVADTDSDGDGTLDCDDGCPADPAKVAPGACGCGVADTDTDSDGTPDCNDDCPNAVGQIGSSCNDGNPNTSPDTLNGSCICVGTPLAGCGVAPNTGCLTSLKTAFAIRKGTTESTDKVQWTWKKGPLLTQQDFADPNTDATYALCVYGPSNTLVFSAVLAPNASWNAIGTNGYKFKDTSTDGLTNAVLKGGAAGKSKALVKGKGEALTLPAQPLDLPLTVQLKKEGSALCLESVFTTTEVKSNTTTVFKARK